MCVRIGVVVAGEVAALTDENEPFPLVVLAGQSVHRENEFGVVRVTSALGSGIAS